MTKLVLSGGGARLAGLDEYVAHKLGIDTVSVGVFDTEQITANNLDAGDVHGFQLSVASGLAMRSAVGAA